MTQFQFWMRHLNSTIGNRPLPSIVFPGSHDAGAYNFSLVGADARSKTQNLEIYDQLMAGSRYLDLRVDQWRGKWYITHGEWTNNLLDDIVQQIKNFLDGHPTEIVLISLRVGAEGSDQFSGDRKKVWELMFEQLGRHHLDYIDDNGRIVDISLVTPNSLTQMEKNLLIFSWGAPQAWDFSVGYSGHDVAPSATSSVSPWGTGPNEMMDREGVYLARSSATVDDMIPKLEAYTPTAGRLWIWHTNTPWQGRDSPYRHAKAHGPQLHIRNLPDDVRDKLNIVNLDFVGEDFNDDVLGGLIGENIVRSDSPFRTWGLL